MVLGVGKKDLYTGVATCPGQSWEWRSRYFGDVQLQGWRWAMPLYDPREGLAVDVPHPGSFFCLATPRLMGAGSRTAGDTAWWEIQHGWKEKTSGKGGFLPKVAQ